MVMKKYFILLALAGLCQSCYILFGLGSADILGGSYDDPLGAQVGIEAKIYDLGENSSLTSGLGVSLQGGSYNDPEGSGAVHLTYLNVPILYTYNSPSRIYGEIGLQPGLLIRAKDDFEGTVYDYMDYVNKFELGLPVGIGYRINDKLNVGIRATYGITNVENSDDSYHNLLTMATVRYNFGWSLFSK